VKHRRQSQYTREGRKGENGRKKVEKTEGKGEGRGVVWKGLECTFDISLLNCLRRLCREGKNPAQCFY